MSPVARRHLGYALCCSWLVTGCGWVVDSPKPVANGASTSSAVAGSDSSLTATEPTEPTKATPQAEVTSLPESEPATSASITSNPVTKAEVATIAGAPTATTPPQLASNTSPTAQLKASTAKESIELINLQTLPKIEVKQELESSATSLFYYASTTLAAADEFYRQALTRTGWELAPHLVASNAQYHDSLYTKQGHYLRLTISGSGEGSEVSITLSALGNVDMRTLPRTADAQPTDSSAVMAGFKSALDINVAAEQLAQAMLETGWQPLIELEATTPELPHFKSLRFRRDAVRVNLGLTKDPAPDSSLTQVFYHAESVMPMDIPTLDHRMPLEVNSSLTRVKLRWNGDRAKLVTLLENHGRPLGWQLLNSEPYLEQKASALYIKTTPSEGTDELAVGLAARFVESQGKFWIDLQRAVLPRPTKPSEPEPTKPAAEVTTSSIPTQATQVTPDASRVADEISAAANELIEKELNKALQGLGQPKP